MALAMGCLVTGVVVPGVTFRDMRRERDVYREAAQDCARTVTIVQGQNAAMLATMRQSNEGSR